MQLLNDTKHLNVIHRPVLCSIATLLIGPVF
jgi:hypothetical protein